MSAKNSLSTLLGNYMSDSDNENDDVQNSNSFSKEIGNLINEIGGETCDKRESLPKTDWTQCMDANTGHPYYWNISTKEVTWEKPAQYEEFLNEIKRVLKKIPDDSWAIGYAEGSETPYYLNIFTREISWQKPANFKEKKRSKKIKKKKQKYEEKETKNIKKKYPKHLEGGSDEDIKIELINSFTNKSATNSEDEDKTKSQNKKAINLDIEQQTSSKINLVSYTSDDEEEGGLENNVNQKEEDNESKLALDVNDSTQMSQKSISKGEKTQITSFASIITGGKVDVEIDDEISKLKEELEKEFVKETKEDEIKTECSSISSNKNNTNVSFDEKNFKRKRRIEFGTNAKHAQNIEEIENEDSRPSFVLTNSDDSKELISKESSNSEKLLAKKKLYSNFKKSHVEFVKSNETKDDDNESNQELLDEKIKFEKEIHDLSELISDKVKFLSVGHAEVSAVQAIRVQLETLLAAFKSSSLSFEYFFKWLKSTSDDLIKLEQNAAPEGWKCKWDRTTAQYCYENLTTNEIRWEFPSTSDTITETNNSSAKDKNDEEVENLLTSNKMEDRKIISNDDVKGEVEMDISTTPPPNENEKIIVQHTWDADNAPPPPRITTPSPPSISTSVIINDELSAFYSDIAKISAESSETNSMQSTTNTQSNSNVIETNNNSLKRTPPREINDQQQIEKKKRKKVKVSGLSMGDKGVSEMVAKWQKAQQQKGYNFW
ncbi:formin-binding protein 4-like [Condylostylus longicornis]|uniref:formin-binding protein 4-like n=1 Tax=Condylostylus longicornis TaxID=2530218 RepID=UPI00244DDAA2|nr:formin-binding protein 4-like [Condylostylus longicornis]